ncbi:MAG: hypothetical protein V1845_00660 [bacterium]
MRQKLIALMFLAGLIFVLTVKVAQAQQVVSNPERLVIFSAQAPCGEMRAAASDVEKQYNDWVQSSRAVLIAYRDIKHSAVASGGTCYFFITLTIFYTKF